MQPFALSMPGISVMDFVTGRDVKVFIPAGNFNFNSLLQYNFKDPITFANLYNSSFQQRFSTVAQFFKESYKNKALL